MWDQECLQGDRLMALDSKGSKDSAHSFPHLNASSPHSVLMSFDVGAATCAKPQPLQTSLVYDLSMITPWQCYTIIAQTLVSLQYE